VCTHLARTVHDTLLY